MFKLTMIVLAIVAVGQTSQAGAQQNLGSARYMLPLCNAWLKIAEKDADAIKNILRADPVRLTTAGMCAGEVIGIVETLRMLESSCSPEGVTNEQIVRMAVKEIEKHPELLHEDFIVPVSAVVMAAWPCRK
jgi:Rap1a immunity proteins